MDSDGPRDGRNWRYIAESIALALLVVLLIAGVLHDMYFD